jgi:hypothetical protein
MSVEGVHMVDLMTIQRTFNSQYLLDDVMALLESKVFPQGRWCRAPRLDCHVQNGRVHFSNVSDNFFAENEIVRVLYPLDNLDLTPSDFWIFGHMKVSLAGKSFSRPEELLDCINAFLEEIHGAELTVVFHEWIERLKWVLDHDGDYYQE